MADAVYEGQEGRWITTKTGRHIFIPNNKSVKEVLQDVFEDFDWEDDPEDWPEGMSYREYNRKKYYEFFVPEITDPDIKAHKDKMLKSFRGIWDASYAYIKKGFTNSLLKKPVYDKSLEDCISNMFANRKNVQRLWIQDIYTKDDSYYNRYYRKMSVKFDGDYYSTLSNFYHEAGHALDATSSGEYSSYIIKSSKYGKSVSELLKEEVTEDKLPKIKELFETISAKAKEAEEKWKAGDISRDEYRSYSRPASQIKSSIGDVVHASLGYDVAKNELGWTGHLNNYFKEYPATPKYNEGAIRRGTEFFAEMVDSLTTNKNKQFAKIMEQIAPKACEAFYEILEGGHGYERKK